MGFSLSFCVFVSIFLLLIPCSSSLCPHTLPCNKSIEIKPPFFLSNQSNHSCNSYIKMGCVNNIPTIYPFDNTNLGYKLESISYENNTLIVQDPYVSKELTNSDCGSFDYKPYFLSSFMFNYTNYEYIRRSLFSYNCDLANNTYRHGNSLHHQNISRDCSNPKNASFEWSLSFNNRSEVLSLIWVRYSIVHSCLEVKSPSCENPPCQATRRARPHLKKILIGSTIGALAFIMACTIFIVKLALLPKFVWKYNTQEGIELILEKYGTLAPKKYKHVELKKLTNSFRDKIGRGGFGTVYKGTQQDGNLVAVKFLHNSSSSGEEFINEVISISRTSHINIVNLLGFSIEGSKALVYEYMPNGSLDKYIYCENPKASLGWEKLYKIAIGIARGLEYLHSGCNTHIVHFDIKPQNILLDEKFCPKIADFGLAKLCPPNESILSRVDMRGTIGFIAPEVFSRSIGDVSTKFDVYSFGMLILEMVGGRRNAKMSVQNSSQVYFPEWIYNHIVENGKIQVCGITNETEEIARKMVLVGLWCTQINPANRPSISRVLEMFERSVDELEIPPKPYSNSPSHSPIFFSSYSSSQLSVPN